MPGFSIVARWTWAAGSLAALAVAVLAAALPARAASQGYPLRSDYPEVAYVDTAALFDRFSEFVIVDIRSRFEFEVAHITGAVCEPLDEEDFPARLAAHRPRGHETPMAFYCNGHDCEKSYIAARAAEAAGFEKVYAYDSGVFDWIEAHPEKAVLLGVSPAQPSRIISDQEFEAHCLDYDDFKSKAGMPETEVIDVRDPVQRESVPELPELIPVRLDDLKELLSSRIWREKRLMFFDAVGSQVRWLQYLLEGYNYPDYWFLKDGVEGVPQRELIKVQNSTEWLASYQAMLCYASRDANLSRNGFAALLHILSQVEFDNYAPVDIAKAVRETGLSKAQLAGALQALVKGKYLEFTTDNGLYVVHVNPSLAWKGDLKGDSRSLAMERFYDPEAK